MPIPITYITVDVTDDNINDLEDVVKLQVSDETNICGHDDNLNRPCTSYKTIRPVVSDLHIFIKLLYWNGK